MTKCTCHASPIWFRYKWVLLRSSTVYIKEEYGQHALVRYFLHKPIKMRSLSAFLGAALLVISYTRRPVSAATVSYPRDIQLHGNRPISQRSSVSAGLNVISDEKVSELK
jgi:hypothetical protein